MHIGEYRHGRMVIDGAAQTKDLIIAGGKIYPRWWRNEGHVLAPDDLDIVWKQRPGRLVVGTGSTGLMRPTPSLYEEAARAGIEVEVMPTTAAVTRFNQLVQTDDVAAAFHLTC